MGTKTIDGTLNVTGGYQVNGSALETGTKIYRHEILAKNSNGNRIWSATIYDYSEVEYTINDFNASANNGRIYKHDCLSFSFSGSSFVQVLPLEIGYHGGAGLTTYCIGRVDDSFGLVEFDFYNDLSTITDEVAPL